MKVFHPSDFLWLLIIPALVGLPTAYQTTRESIYDKEAQKVSVTLDILNRLYDSGYSFEDFKNYESILETACSKSDSKMKDYLSYFVAFVDTQSFDYVGNEVPCALIYPLCMDLKRTNHNLSNLIFQKHAIRFLFWLSVVAAISNVLYRIGWIKGMLEYLRNPLPTTESSNPS